MLYGWPRELGYRGAEAKEVFSGGVGRLTPV